MDISVSKPINRITGREEDYGRIIKVNHEVFNPFTIYVATTYQSFDGYIRLRGSDRYIYQASLAISLQHDGCMSIVKDRWYPNNGMDITSRINYSMNSMGMDVFDCLTIVNTINRVVLEINGGDVFYWHRIKKHELV